VKLFEQKLDSPFGPVSVAVDEDGALVKVVLPNGQDSWAAEVARKGISRVPDDDRCDRAVGQLSEYFDHDRTTFDLALRPLGTQFQKGVWAALTKIPYGKTATYGEIALQLGNPAAVRAVGRANGANPIPIVIPCHRVIGSDGSLTGFGGGLGLKRSLLELESGNAGRGQGRVSQLAFF
jgi:methylated-DNA-[protein]-cysteine S-methyltransferase